MSNIKIKKKKKSQMNLVYESPTGRKAWQQAGLSMGPVDLEDHARLSKTI